MARTIPESYDALPPSYMGNGAADRLRILTALSGNPHHLYGKKAPAGGFGASGWNIGPSHTSSLLDAPLDPDEFKTPFELGPQVSGSYELARFRIPRSLNGKRRARVLAGWTGDSGVVDVLFRDGDGNERTLTLGAPEEENFELSPGDWIATLKLPFGLVAFQLLSLAVYYPRAKYNGEDPRWTALKQGAAQADRPDSSYRLQTLLLGQAHSLVEAGSVIFSRYFGLPWAKSGTSTLVGHYRFFVEARIPRCRCYIYARVREDSGEAQLVLNGSPVLGADPIALTTSWQLLGPYLLNTSPDALNLLEVYGRKLTGTGEGHGVQVAGVYVWEDPPDEDGLGIVSGDTIPAEYQGNQNSLIRGLFPILANEEGTASPVRVGRELAGDVLWLKANRRRLLVQDWRMRTQPVGSNWLAAISYQQRTANGAIPFPPDGSQANPGSVLARLLLPPQKGLSTARVRLRVGCARADGLSGIPDNPPIWTLYVHSPTTVSQSTTRISAETTGMSTVAQLEDNSRAVWTSWFEVQASESVPTEIVVEAFKQDGDDVTDALVLYGCEVGHRPLGGTIE